MVLLLKLYVLVKSHEGQTKIIIYYHRIKSTDYTDTKIALIEWDSLPPLVTFQVTTKHLIQYGTVLHD